MMTKIDKHFEREQWYVKDIEIDNLVSFPKGMNPLDNPLKDQGLEKANEESFTPEALSTQERPSIEAMMSVGQELAIGQDLIESELNSFQIPHLEYDEQFFGKLKSIDEVISLMEDKLENLEELFHRMKFYTDEIDIHKIR
ncbi:MAG: hypothetical protein ACPGJV_14110 [Bacteriovoracaceae bacterium]